MDDVIDVEVQALLCYRALVSRDRLLERCPWAGLEDALDGSNQAAIPLVAPPHEVLRPRLNLA